MVRDGWSGPCRLASPRDVILTGYVSCRRYTATSQGTLHVRDIDEDDVGDTYYCQTQHVMSNDVRLSSGAQVIVKGKLPADEQSSNSLHRVRF